jgi:two-component system KDP operon response regulator KdpE
VSEAQSAGRGVLEVGTRKPDLIVLDLGLPDRDEVALVGEVRAFSCVPAICGST